MEKYFKKTTHDEIKNQHKEQENQKINPKLKP